MVLSKRQKTGIIVVIVIGVLGLVGWWIYKKKEYFSGVEPGAVRNAINADYDNIDTPASYDYANMITPSQGNHPQRPLEQFNKQIPNPDSSVTGYDVDVSDPKVFLWRPNVRVNLKNRQHEGADFYRGDLPIVSRPKTGWFDSRYSEGDNMINGYFSPYMQSKIQGVGGEANSYPTRIANEETIMDSY